MRRIFGIICLLLGILGAIGTVSAHECGFAEPQNDASLARLPRTNLLVYHDKNGESRAVTSRAEWQKRRAEILRGMQQSGNQRRLAAMRMPHYSYVADLTSLIRFHVALLET